MFEVVLVSQEGQSFSEQVDRLTFVSLDGQQTLLIKHMPIKIALANGKGYYLKANQKVEFYHSQGLLKFKDDQAVLLLADFVFKMDLTETLAREKIDQLLEVNSKSNHAKLSFWEFCLNTIEK